MRGSVTARDVCIGKSDGSACTVNGQSGYVCDKEVCIPSVCGDAILDANTGEECDDGTANSDSPNAACRSNCHLPSCGDGIVDDQLGEACDDGNNIDGDGCSADCSSTSVCGNRVVETGEVCDDGNNTDGDGCSADCKSDETCGNGYLDAVLGEECDDANNTDWDGCNSCSIVEFRVNTHTSSGQSFPAVAMAPDGRFVIAWQSNGQDGSGKGIYAQLYDASGLQEGTEFQVNTYTNDDQSYPAVAMGTDGRFVIVWQSKNQDGSGTGIYAQRYNPDGSPNGSEFQVNTYTSGNQTHPAVAMTPDGRFVVVWESNGQDSDSSYSIYAQRYDASGTATGGEFLVNTTTANHQSDPSVAMAPDGRFVITWEGLSADFSSDIYARLYDATGAPITSEFQTNIYTTLSQQFPVVSRASDGSFIIVWQSDGQDPDSSYGVFAQRYTADGTPVGNMPMP